MESLEMAFRCFIHKSWPVWLVLWSRVTFKCYVSFDSFCCILWITDSFNVRFCVSVLCQSLFISAVLCHFQISVCMCLTGASSNLFKSPLWRSVHSDGGDWQVSSCSPCWLLCCSSSVSITSPLPPSSTSTHLTQNLNPTGVAFRLETDDGSDPGNF